MNKRKEVPVRNNPGIYKRFVFEETTRTWVDTGRFRAVRRIRVDGRSRKESAVFDDLVSAKAFRSGEQQRKTTSPGNLKSFAAYLEEWKTIHYLKLQPGTAQTYDKRLPNLDFLKRYRVEEITVTVVDKLVRFWREMPVGRNRTHYDMELDLLKTILSSYRRRIQLQYAVPVLEEHYQAARLRNEAKRPVESLTEEELGRFLAALRTGRSPHYYSLALIQFGLGLRIGEVCGLCWESVDLEERMAVIDRQIEWDQKTWKPTLKRRPKGGKIRYVAIPETVARELVRLKALSDPRVAFVFHRNGVPFTRNKVGPAYNRALRRIGVSRVSGTHILRKTSATLGTDRTGNFFAVSQFLGHASPQETLRYVKPLSGQKIEVAQALDAVLGALAPVSSNPDRNEAAPEKDLERNARRRALSPSGERREIIDEKVPSGAFLVPSCPPGKVRPNLKLVITNS